MTETLRRDWHILDAGLHPARPIRKPHDHYPLDRCREQHAEYANLCDRKAGHTGRHASYGPTLVLAVWA